MYISIKDLKDGQTVNGIYLCSEKRIELTKANKEYANIVIQDKTGTIQAKIWNLAVSSIRDFEKGDFVDISGRIVSFNGSLQFHIDSLSVVDKRDVDIKNFIPVTSKNIDEMYKELLSFISSISNEGIKALLKSFFVEDKEFSEKFIESSAAKTVHHAFMGGLLEHTLGVVRLCDFYCKQYPELDRDLLISGAMLHDVGKVYELSDFPANDYTDDGQLLGHIMIGYELVSKKGAEIKALNSNDLLNIKHLILSHHGELEYGSPKKPCIIEAFALNFADVTDSKLETVKEYLDKGDENAKWVGKNLFLGTNIARTSTDNGRTSI